MFDWVLITPLLEIIELKGQLVRYELKIIVILFVRQWVTQDEVIN